MNLSPNICDPSFSNEYGSGIVHPIMRGEIKRNVKKIKPILGYNQFLFIRRPPFAPDQEHRTEPCTEHDCGGDELWDHFGNSLISSCQLRLSFKKIGMFCWRSCQIRPSIHSGSGVIFPFLFPVSAPIMTQPTPSNKSVM